MPPSGRRSLLSAFGTSLALPLAGCLGSIGGPDLEQRRQRLAENHDTVVGMRAAADFVPEHITVDVGDSVAWLNDSDYQHSVTAYEDNLPDGADYFASGGFDAEEKARKYSDPGEGLLETGDSYTHTFEIPGAYAYFCIPHEDAMTGTVTVEP